MKKREVPTPKIVSGQWLSTYADLMNNLLVLFILLYAMSITDLQKFEQIMSGFANLFGNNPTTVSAPISGGYVSFPDSSAIFNISKPESNNTSSDAETSDESNSSGQLDDLDEFVKKITTIIIAKGYQDKIFIERIEDYIYFRFPEGVLFEPNVAVLKKSSYEMLKFVYEIIDEVYDEILRIEICGHTAWVPNDDIQTDFNTWEVSANRAMTVLKYFVAECGLPKTKMSTAAYSSTMPYTNGTTEEQKQQNRRVEVRLLSKQKK